MPSPRTKTAIVAGIGVLLAVGIVIAVKMIHRTYPWQDMSDGGQRAMQALDTMPPQVTIVRSKFAKAQPHPRFYDDLGSPDRWRFIFVHITPEEIVRAAYFDYTTHIDNDFSFLVVTPPDMPGGYYDCIANLPSGSRDAMQKLVKEKFGLIGKYEMRDIDVLTLQMERANASGLKPGTPPPAGTHPPSRISNGLVHYKNRSMPELAALLERRLEFPVVDETGLAGTFDFDAPVEFGGPNVPGKTGATSQRTDGANLWLIANLGLKLVPARQAHEVFVIEKIKG
jgi:uncharacterized protein (TIGR03435 family)